jgi:hypothetical protein
MHSPGESGDQQQKCERTIMIAEYRLAEAERTVTNLPDTVAAIFHSPLLAQLIAHLIYTGGAPPGAGYCYG